MLSMLWTDNGNAPASIENYVKEWPGTVSTTLLWMDDVRTKEMLVVLLSGRTKIVFYFLVFWLQNTMALRLFGPKSQLGKELCYLNLQCGNLGGVNREWTTHTIRHWAPIGCGKMCLVIFVRTVRVSVCACLCVCAFDAHVWVFYVKKNKCTILYMVLDLCLLITKK